METTKEERRKALEAYEQSATAPPLLHFFRALCCDVDTLVGLLRRAALGEEPQIRAFHDPLCGECLGCQARAVLGE